MKDYGYARGLLHTVGFVLWLGLLAGIAFAYLTARSGSPISIAVGIITAVGVMVSTVLSLAFVQVGHAIIDIAENTARMAAKGSAPQERRDPQLRGGEQAADLPLEPEGLRAVRRPT